jgi:hypothetical protein
MREHTGRKSCRLVDRGRTSAYAAGSLCMNSCLIGHDTVVWLENDTRLDRASRVRLVIISDED